MTGEEKRSRRTSIVIKILVLAVIFILFCASVILTVQVIKMRPLTEVQMCFYSYLKKGLFYKFFLT